MAAESEHSNLLAIQRVLPRAGSLMAFAAAAFVLAAASLIKLPLDAWAGDALPPYITFFPAIAVASLIGGPRVGLTTAAAALAIAWYLWLPIENSFVMEGRQTPLTIGIFAASSGFLAWIVGMARLTLDQSAANEAERALAARESVHRIKNLLAVVAALVAKIEREAETTQEFKDLLSKRLAALDIAQNVLVRQDWQDATIEEITEGALAPFLPNPKLKVEGGPQIKVPARYVGGLCLALYELCTNALKYGALSHNTGQAVLSWRADASQCLLEWRETRNAQAPADASGFGSLLIKTALSRDPDTRVDYEFTASHVIASFRWPTRTSARSAAA